MYAATKITLPYSINGGSICAVQGDMLLAISLSEHDTHRNVINVSLLDSTSQSILAEFEKELDEDEKAPSSLIAHYIPHLNRLMLVIGTIVTIYRIDTNGI